MNEALWKILLTQIRARQVVPVVGPRLLVAADGRTSVLAGVAEKLLSNHGIEVEPGSLPPFRELSEAYNRLQASSPSLDSEIIYNDVHELLRSADAIGGAGLPLPLRQLAEITDFPLLVTLTPDDGLARALARSRGRAVDEIVHSPSRRADQCRDLVQGWAGDPGHAHLLYLFGKAGSPEYYALHDEDVLEYAHSLLGENKQRPNRFLDELRERSKLLIGCNFPDWLSRLFLRLTSRDRLAVDGGASSSRKWVVEPLSPEEGLSIFLQRHSKRTELTSALSPPEFVAELHRRWLAGRPAEASGLPEAAVQGSRGTVFFVSYSRSADYPHARAFVEFLQTLGAGPAEVWFDGHTIEPGYEFRSRITDGIDACRYFVPLVSAAADTREEGWAFAEWRKANERLEKINRDFVVPVVVDAQFNPDRYSSPPVRRWRDIDFGFAPSGTPTEALAKRLTDLLREARRSSNQAPLAI